MNSDWLIIGNVTLAILWGISEILSVSTCEANGVFQFVFASCGGCLNGKKIIVDVHIQEAEAIVVINGAPPVKVIVPPVAPEPVVAKYIASSASNV